jgi:hypothetical protein
LSEPYPRHTNEEVRTNVKQGALIGAAVCLALGLVLEFASLMTFFLYGPLFFAAFVLSIVAMAQKRVLGGVLLLVATLLIPSVAGIVLASTRIPHALESNKKNIAAAQERALAVKQQNPDYTKFEVLNSRLYKSKEGFLDINIIELAVRNGTPKAISKVRFEATLTGEGRSVPYAKGNLVYQVAGGLEPGEKATWHLRPNMFEDFGKVEVKSGMKLQIRILTLYGSDGSEL